jgi:hypothetical protein
MSNMVVQYVPYIFINNSWMSRPIAKDMLGKHVQGYRIGVRLWASYIALQFHDVWMLYADKSIQSTLNLKRYAI